ncbi:hypothetical protein CH13_gp086 [Mycobacterium phage Echild]|nr:hypothetical protein CH13_gp086 [Mycobacterium phage Echild]AHG24307.1 hypothetical protein PBI_ECHILD_86 [Mycobacterium phage Echild]
MSLVMTMLISVTVGIAVYLW